MTIEILSRANELHQKSLALKADLELLREICTEPVPLVIFSPHSERMVQLDALPKLVCDMAMDVLICAFERGCKDRCGVCGVGPERRSPE